VPVDINNIFTTGPNNPDCISCMFPSSNKPVAGTPIGQDPNCNACAGGTTTCPQKGWYTPAAPAFPITADDGLGARYGRQVMRQKYGYDNQHNYQRYVDGLKSPTVPDRDNESHDAANYAPNRNCTNPLFAGSLPDGTDTSPAALCQLPPGARAPSSVFYLVIGGVPNQLITDGNGNLELSLSDADWQAVLGQDPNHYIFDGIDPHMIQSTAPRAGLLPEDAPPTTYDLGTDPVQGREWNTLTANAGIDLQYACVFTLPAPKDCTMKTDCECTGVTVTAPDAAPLCDPNTRTTQVRNRGYPSSRDLLVAKALGAQSLVGSICPADSSGYVGVLAGLVDKMSAALGNGCLPAPLPQMAGGETFCSVIGVYGAGDPGADCTDPGMSPPTADMRPWLAANLQGQTNAQEAVSACVLQQLPSCSDRTQNGWCYESPANGCAQAIAFDQHPEVPLFLLCPVASHLETD
jgi:hypothetical protein